MDSIEAKTNRVKYFDVLKGVAIILVVMGHVVTYGIYKIDSSIFFRLAGLIHMPLFFFISGWFSIRISKDGCLRIPDIKKRFLQLILPTIFISTIWIFYYPHSGLPKDLDSTFCGLWGNLWKNGYWFTPVLFCIISVYGLGACIGRFFKSKPVQVFFIVTLVVLLGIASSTLPKYICDALSIPFIFKYFPVFLFGGWASCHRRRFMQWTQGGGYTAALITSSILAFLILYHELLDGRLPDATIPWRDIAQMIFHCTLAIVAIRIAESACARKKSYGDSSSPVSNILAFIGKKSLQIYLLHYFFLFPMQMLRNPLIGMNLGFVPVGLIAAIAAILIIAVCLCLDFVIGKSNLLGLILLGKYTPNSFS